MLGWINWSWTNERLQGRFHTDPVCAGCKAVVAHHGRYYLGKEVKLWQREQTTKEFSPFLLYCSACYEKETKGK